MDVLLRVKCTSEVCLTQFLKDKWMSVHPNKDFICNDTWMFAVYPATAS